MRLGVQALYINHPVTQSYVTISAGVATFIPNANLVPSDLIARADQALLQAKQQGRNRVILY
jgi:PleD family two-component response regulator